MDMALKQVRSLADVDLPDKGTVDIVRGETTLRIPIKAITQADQNRITEEFKAPAPPVQWRKNPETNKMEQFANELDAGYQDTVRKNTMQQTQAFILLGIEMTVPGEDDDAKWQALSERFTLGEMNSILTGIMELSQLNQEAIEAAKNSLTRTPDQGKTPAKSE
jgi:hypothetical protein